MKEYIDILIQTSSKIHRSIEVYDLSLSLEDLTKLVYAFKQLRYIKIIDCRLNSYPQYKLSYTQKGLEEKLFVDQLEDMSWSETEKNLRGILKELAECVYFRMSLNELEFDGKNYDIEKARKILREVLANIGNDSDSDSESEC